MQDPFADRRVDPDDPALHQDCMRITDMRTMAIAAHELYTSLQEAGFNDDQAFRMTQTLITLNSSGGQS